MKNYRINPNKKLVNTIMEGLQRKNGHCPCRLNVDDTTLCPCDEFIKDGIWVENLVQVYIRMKYMHMKEQIQLEQQYIVVIHLLLQPM